MASKKRPKRQTELELEERAVVEDTSLADETQRRYLNYALSVITARALPDVRDGLKPVQRRILFTMHRELGLRPDGRYKKSANVVGDVIGKYHPHGDQAIYDTMVRMAQSFSMRHPLVDGRGNFGSPDGDPPAAYRYTEAKLMPLAEELLRELGQDTVNMRPTFDGERSEPTVLPARFPNLLVNGAYGIAVGMATSIPTHNLGEVVKALVAMIDEPTISLKRVLRHIKGPDFPTGGQLLCSKSELEAVYETGQGSLKLRGTYEVEEQRRIGRQIVITSIPYAVERRHVVEKIFDIIASRKLPSVVRVWDESTDDCRIVCELKKDADPQLVMAYLYKNTPLSTNVQLNLTCLVPTDGEVPAPRRLSLVEMLRYFLDFRLVVVTRRLTHDLEQLNRRIHILEGFETVFDALDETIRIIRRSEGRQDAAAKLMKRFGLDQEQVDEILNLRLYRLARLQILLIQKELEEKRGEAKRIAKLLKSEPDRWKLVRAELTELASDFGTARLTAIVGELDEPEFDAEAFIVEEDAMVVLTVQGWVKRQQRVKEIGSTRVRDGDAVFEVVAGSTRSSVAFFSNTGACYVARLVDIPATTGYGVPVQTLFKMGDGERIVEMMGFDPRFFEVPEPDEDATEPEEPYALAVTAGGMALRFSLRSHREPSTKSGRKFARPRGGDEVVFVSFVEEGDRAAVASRSGRALICEADEVSLLSGAGKGVTLIKLQKGDAVIGAAVLGGDDDMLVVENQNGTKLSISTGKYGVVSRAGKGFQLIKRGRLERMIWGEPTIPGFPAGDEEE